MAIKTDEAAQLEHVRSDLIRHFKDLPADQIEAEFQRALGGFTGAKVRTFVPVMVQKRASDALRHLTPA